MESVNEQPIVPPIIDLDVLHSAAVGFMHAWDSGKPVTYGTGNNIDDKFATFVGSRTVTTKEFNRDSFVFLGEDLKEHLTEPGAYYFISYVGVDVSRDGFIIKASIYKKR
ncbi:hypothetical protein pEaSNUABM54_00279 [Erwinia phage pEa_SNUABM_54]|nr:hypothetical protein pEaSNUABM54_00279 [Erwinia phage pEa_SNUABM_54]